MVGKEYLDPEVSHKTHRPIPTCLRNHAMISEVNAGRGPIHMVTMEAFQDPHLEEVGWENFLGMTVGQAVLWAATVDAVIATARQPITRDRSNFKVC